MQEGITSGARVRKGAGGLYRGTLFLFLRRTSTHLPSVLHNRPLKRLSTPCPSSSTSVARAIEQTSPLENDSYFFLVTRLLSFVTDPPPLPSKAELGLPPLLVLSRSVSVSGRGESLWIGVNGDQIVFELPYIFVPAFLKNNLSWIFYRS